MAFAAGHANTRHEIPKWHHGWQRIAHVGQAQANLLYHGGQCDVIADEVVID
ncbi:hypothetical protein DyAD56_13260 [Dyella sp. AD56]|nr:hypothetical protein DyAD56_13260 [Dyella sp. AD56]